MTSANTDAAVLPEPRLAFRYGQALSDPRDGLAMFGPYDTDLPSHPKNISYAVIGTPRGVEALEKWVGRLQSPIQTDEGLDARLWPMFPGFEAAFACSFPLRPTRSVQLEESSLLLAAKDGDPHKRVSAVTQRYLDAIQRMGKRDEQLDVIICVVPDLVHQNCRPLSRVSGGVGYSPSSRSLQERKRGQMDMFDIYDPEIYQYSPDFRRQIKARAMQFGIPIQIIQESTLRLVPPRFGERRLTPLCDRAWNLGVALYYKAGGKPWRLSTAREGVCYIGLAYRRKDPSSGSRSACCAAQMFLDSGDGIVFMGEYGPWYSPQGRDFHLTPEAARELLAGVLKTYQDLEGKPLREVFLHCRSSISREEFAGFQESCPQGTRLVGVRVRQEHAGLKLFREGSRPVLRGTFWQCGDRSGYLWGTGFKPRLNTYDGWETPTPLRLDIQHGDGDIRQVATDILGLTKLNYNACRLGESEPVTVGFSGAVGEILVSNPSVTVRSPKFKYYI